MGHGDTWAAVSGPALVDGGSLLPGGAEGSWVGGGACRAWHCLYSVQAYLVQGELPSAVLSQSNIQLADMRAELLLHAKNLKMNFLEQIKVHPVN